MVIEWSKYITLAIEYRKYCNSAERNKILNELISRYDPTEFVITSTENSNTGCIIVFDIESAKKIKKNENNLKTPNADIPIEEKDGITLTKVEYEKGAEEEITPDISPINNDTKYIDINVSETNIPEKTEKDRMRKIFLQELHDDIQSNKRKQKTEKKLAGMWEKIWHKIFGHKEVITDPARILEEKPKEQSSSISNICLSDDDYKGIADLVVPLQEPLYKGPTEEDIKRNEEAIFEPNIEELFGQSF